MRLAQLDRAFGYGPKGRGFESSIARYCEDKCPRFFVVLIKALYTILRFHYSFILRYYVCSNLYEKAFIIKANLRTITLKEGEQRDNIAASFT